MRERKDNWEGESKRRGRKGVCMAVARVVIGVLLLLEVEQGLLG